MGIFTTDPFTQVHQALWGIFTDYKPWANLIRAGARINAAPAGPLSTKVPALTPGSTPQFEICPLGGSVQVQNSQAWRIDRSYAFKITTSQLNVIQLDQIEFYTMVALMKSPGKLGLSFVSGWRWEGPVREQQMTPDGIEQWCAVFGASVTMMLANDDLANL